MAHRRAQATRRSERARIRREDPPETLRNRSRILGPRESSLTQVNHPAALPTPAPPVPLLAGGCIVIKGIGPRRRIALVERNGMTGLPRAMALGGKSLLVAAREASREQLGHEFRPLDFVAACSADLGETRIVTLYWRGRLDQAVPDFQDGERVYWALISEAARHLDYNEEAELIEEEFAQAPIVSAFGPIRRLRRSLRAQAVARHAEEAALAMGIDRPDAELQVASALASARSASHLRGPGAQELAATLFHAAELRDLALMDPADLALSIRLVAQELDDLHSADGLLLGTELRDGGEDALLRVQSARASRATQARIQELSDLPPWLRYLAPVLVLIGAPLVLRNETLDAGITALHLPWTSALWAGLAGACILPRRSWVQGQVRLDTSFAWLGAGAGLAIWLGIRAGFWPGGGSPPSGLFAAALAGALLHRLVLSRNAPS